MADELRADLDQFLREASQRPILVPHVIDFEFDS
jgi:hypothetical protein